ncbi:MAG: tetratricopeptide repeat protein [Defluviitaleaceae bacterium]|nr:tetratricopeptide repeat protein [Defluviitaleaceae bacterium]
MASFLPSDVIKEVRARRRMARMAMQDVMSYSGMKEDAILSQLTILRAEKGRQNIRVDNFNKLMDTLDMSVDTFFIPCIENQTTELLQLYDTLTCYTTYAKEDTIFRQKGLDLLSEMKENDNFSQGINRQILISQEVVLMETLGKDPAEIRRLIKEGLSITYPELVEDPITGDMLIFEEGPLLHNMARTYMREDNTSYAIALLGDIFTGLTLLPQDDKDKERMYAPMLLTMAQCYIQEKNYDEALDTCDAGHKIALKRNNGFYVPDFAELKVYCLHATGATGELSQLIPQAIAGYVLLRRHNKADGLLQYAQEHGISINTHGIETVRPPMPQPIYTHGKVIACDSIGGLISQLKYDAELTLQKLCDGLCTTGTLSKIEGMRYPLDKVYLLEAIMQRLGRHINHYFNTFISFEDFENKQLRDEINISLVNGEYPEAKELLEKLIKNVNEAKKKDTIAMTKKKRYYYNIITQFIEMAKASLYCEENGYTAVHIAMLHDVINLTREKELDIGLVARTRLTYRELLAVNQMANSLCGMGKMREGLRLFEDLLESMNRYYVDEHEKIRMYTTVQYNYSTWLGREGRHKESLELAIIGDEMDVKHCRLQTLPNFAVNRACGMLSLGDKENCLPFFALAYYGSGLLGRQKNISVIKSYVKEHLGVDF